ncbi:MAG: RHS repeat-associated core domain-containing protein, partial [Oscillospiraceae bacterium]
TEKTVHTSITPDPELKNATEERRYAYDKNGNQLSCEREVQSPVKTNARHAVGFLSDIEILEVCDYNGFNQLIHTFKDNVDILYNYKPDGMRYRKTVDGKPTTHLWDGQNIVFELGENNTVKGRYLRGTNLLARVQDGNRQYYLHNFHGDVSHLSDTQGTILQKYEYDAFGNEMEPNDKDSNPFRYCGEYWDKETKTIYLRARNYNPRTGRFSQEDPIKDGRNWYAYCQDNPILWIDPTGLDVYYFYDPYVHDDQSTLTRTGDIYMEVNKKDLAEYFGVPVNIIELTTYDQFFEEWAGMDDSKGPIDAVVIVAHGDRYSLNLPLQTAERGYDFIRESNLSSLESKNIDLFMTIGCENGSNAGITEHQGNWLQSLMYANNIDKAIASDGISRSPLAETVKDQQSFPISSDRQTQSGDPARGFLLYERRDMPSQTNMQARQNWTGMSMGYQYNSLSHLLNTAKNYDRKTSVGIGGGRFVMPY